jgi:hypothetical protein
MYRLRNCVPRVDTEVVAFDHVVEGKEVGDRPRFYVGCLVVEGFFFFWGAGRGEIVDHAGAEGGVIDTRSFVVVAVDDRVRAVWQSAVNETGKPWQSGDVDCLRVFVGIPSGGGMEGKDATMGDRRAVIRLRKRLVLQDPCSEALGSGRASYLILEVWEVRLKFEVTVPSRKTGILSFI